MNGALTQITNPAGKWLYSCKLIHSDTNKLFSMGFHSDPYAKLRRNIEYEILTMQDRMKYTMYAVT